MTNPVLLTFDVASFRLQFPAFADPVVFPDARLQMYWDMATAYVSDVGNYGWLQGTQRQLVLNMMTAHLTALSVIVAAGEVPGVVTSATIDKITVTLQAPPEPNQWQWWLNQTPYGQQMLALLKVLSAGGFYIGGSPQRAAFRNVGGFFG